MMEDHVSDSIVQISILMDSNKGKFVFRMPAARQMTLFLKHPIYCHPGLQSRPSGAVTAPEAMTQFTMPQPAASQGVAHLNHQGVVVPHSADAQLSQQGWGVPHSAEAQALARPSLQALTVPPAAEGQVLAQI